MNNHDLGPDGQLLCHHSEALRLEAYPDPASPLARAKRAGKPTAGLSGAPWTIGWGDTGPDVVEGLVITREEADRRFARRMAKEFLPAIRELVRVELNQSQFDALASFVYNVGIGNFEDSTLLRLINSGDMEGAAGQFKRWNKAGGLVMKGLDRRRYAEAYVFVGGRAEVGIQRALAVFP